MTLQQFFAQRMALLALAVCSGFSLLYAQAPVVVEEIPQTEPYVFLHEELNSITNAEAGLSQFYAKLDELRQGKRSRVTIVHIGDSHIQADAFSGTLRKALQNEFGCAGRGLIFPYRVAGTNGPDDVRSESNTAWESRRVARNGSLPIGASGITLRTTDPNFVLKLSLRDAQANGLDNRFNKVTLFTDRSEAAYSCHVSTSSLSELPHKTVTRTVHTSGSGNTYHTIRSGETLGGIAQKYHVSVTNLKQWNGLRSNMIRAGQKIIVKKGESVQVEVESEPIPETAFQDVGYADNSYPSNQPHEIYLPELVSSVYLRGDRTQASQSQATFYGIALENTQNAGILYHTAGVNGAQFDHYNGAAYFMEQIAALNPDLVIVSLGTNETLAPYFDKAGFESAMNTFVQDVNRYMPQANVLLTSPPDTYRRRKYPNVHVPDCRDAMVSYALNNNCAFWDFYEVMGGAKSIVKWQAKHLAQYDKVHLTNSGYALQGRLLRTALMKGFGEWRLKHGME